MGGEPMPDLDVAITGSEGPFGVIPLTILEDPGLSWKAKALWTYLRSRPPGWTVRESDLIRRATDGRDAVRSGVRELEDHDPPLLRRERQADGQGKYTGWVWTILAPTDGKSVTGPTDGFSGDGKSGDVVTSKGTTSSLSDPSYEGSASNGADLVLVSEDQDDGKVLAQRSGRLMASFIRMYGGKVDQRTRGRWGACCRRLVESWTDPEIAGIAAGMRQKYPWSEGEPFDPFDMERHAAKALAMASERFESAEEAADREWEEKMRNQM